MSIDRPLDTIPHREPVIGRRFLEETPRMELDREWGLVTEAIRREIRDHPATRSSLATLVTHPVDETLPLEMLSRVSTVDQRVARLQRRYQEQLTKYLSFPPVPEKEIVPDIRNASLLSTPAELIPALQRLYKDEPERIQEAVDVYIRSGYFLRGITPDERDMAIQRSRFARDCKLLSLGAEMLQQGVVTPNEQGEVHLPSGTTMVIAPERMNDCADLLNPLEWRRRRQIKDRVYEIQAGTSTYILKERKTKMHTDTKQHGHVPGLTARQEFETARYFREHGELEQGNVAVRWENPIACIAFPDGFEFTVYEFEEQLMKVQDAVEKTTAAICERREQFEDEFKQVAAAAERWKETPQALRVQVYEPESDLMIVVRTLFNKKPKPKPLTFEQFAQVKAHRMKEQAKDLMTEAIYTSGYTNSDSDGFAFTVQQSPSVRLEIFGMDFEYFARERAEETRERFRRHREFFREYRTTRGIGFLYWGNGEPVQRIQQAAYLGMLELEDVLSAGQP